MSFPISSIFILSSKNGVNHWNLCYISGQGVFNIFQWQQTFNGSLRQLSSDQGEADTKVFLCAQFAFDIR